MAATATSIKAVLMKSFLAKRWGDILAIGLLLVALSLSFLLYLPLSKVGNDAHITYRGQEIATYRLNKAQEETIEIDDVHMVLIIDPEQGVAVRSSNCPKQECVHRGYISRKGETIVCAYNAVVVTVGEGDYDIEI